MANEAFARWRDENPDEWDSMLARTRRSMAPWLVGFWWRCLLRARDWMMLKKFIGAIVDLIRERWASYPVDPDVVVGIGCLLALILFVVFA